MAYAFNNPTTAVLKANVGTNANGYLATGTDEVAGTKSFSIPGVKADATLAQAGSVFDAFVGTIANGKFDSLSTTKTVTYSVVETA